MSVGGTSSSFPQTSFPQTSFPQTASDPMQKGIVLSEGPKAFSDPRMSVGYNALSVPQNPAAGMNAVYSQYGLDPTSHGGAWWQNALQTGQASLQDLQNSVSQIPGASQMQSKGIVLSERPKAFFPPLDGSTNPGTPPGTPPGNGFVPPSPTPIPYNPYPGYPTQLPPMPADNTPRFYGPSFLNNSVTGRLFQMTPQMAQFRDAQAGNPNLLQFAK